jgi:hypothetical protein
MQNDPLRDELHRNSLREWQRLSWGQSADKLTSIYNQHVAGVAA